MFEHEINSFASILMTPDWPEITIGWIPPTCDSRRLVIAHFAAYLCSFARYHSHAYV